MSSGISMLRDLSILVTGGTGSFGKAFVRTVLNTAAIIKRLVIFSRDGMKQIEMEQEFCAFRCPDLRNFIGGMREQQRLRRLLEGIDTVVHAAALMTGSERLLQ